MSNSLVTAVYRTKIGNPTAKSVLALLADRANDEGFCFPSNDSIVRDTELSMRQVQRILQIFGNIGLIVRHETRAEQYDHYFVIKREMLGKNLSEAFTAEHEKLQKQRPSVCQTPPVDDSQTQVDDSQTPSCDSQTQSRVCQTFPPHPLIGVTIIEPPIEPPFEPAHASEPAASPRTVVVMPTPSALPYLAAKGVATSVSLPPPEYSDLIRRIVCAHPRALLRSWGPEEVPYADLTTTIEAVDAEAKKAGCDQMEAGRFILSRCQLLADKVPRGEWRYLKPPGEFMRLREYRMEPEEFLRSAPTQTTARPSYAEADHAREQEEIRAARARRAATS